MQVYQKVYFSNSTEKFHEDTDLDTILQGSVKNNESKDITGLLLYKGGCFLQLLEGEKEVVEDLYDKIYNDPRHKNIITLVDGNYNERLFPYWSMSCRKLTSMDIDEVNKIINWTRFIRDTSSVSNEQIRQLFKAFQYKLSA